MRTVINFKKSKHAPVPNYLMNIDTSFPNVLSSSNLTNIFIVIKTDLNFTDMSRKYNSHPQCAVTMPVGFAYNYKFKFDIKKVHFTYNDSLILNRPFHGF